MLYLCPLILGACVTVWFNIARVRKIGVMALLLKASSSVLFILTAIACTYKAVTTDPASLPYALLLIAGLAFGMLGDIWLDLKFVYPPDNVPFTYGGFISFAIGHLFFIAAIVQSTGLFRHIGYLLVPLAIALVFAVGVQIVQKPMGMVYGSYAAIVSIYTFILVTTTFLAGAAALYGLRHAEAGWNNTRYIVLFVGGVFFLISDLILSGTYFGEGKDRPVDIVTNHMTYYIAQYLIALSIAFV